ncbi:hypothetical protein D6779_11620, partial [Candidatus Parcubacteria bacterium]
MTERVRYTAYRDVGKTVWRKVTQRVPILGEVGQWLGKVVGWVKKTVWRSVSRVVKEAYTAFRTVRRRVANYIRERVQAGWDFITKRVPN